MHKDKEITPTDFFTNTDLICGICYLPFNTSTQLPLIACDNKHIVCSACIRPIRRNKKCPYCRLPLHQERLKIDYKTLDKIPQDPLKPNMRTEVNGNHNEYYELSPEPSIRDSQSIEDGLFWEVQENWDMERRIIMDETARKRAIIYLCTVLFVIPVFVLDTYFGYFYFSQPKCTDYAFLFGAVNLRTWLVVISFTEAIYLIILMLSFLKRKFGNMYQQFYLNSLEQVYSMGIMFKAVICSVVELVYFFGIVTTACKGPIYVYELVLACVHMIKLTAVAAALIRQWCF